jgi:hypothetical protein
LSKELATVSKHMIGLGLGALAHANWHSAYFSHDNPYWSELSVLQAAHAGEILIKARIAQEHPLLIFDQLPKAQEGEEPLSLHRLVEYGRTFQFADLPDRLWATTGIKLPAPERFRAFGRLRNSIQHFTVPIGMDVAGEALRFTFEVIDPFINACWGLCAIDYNEDHEPYTYFVPVLIRRGIRFMVSAEMMKDLRYMDLEWPADDDHYRRDMEARFEAARQAQA